MSEKELSNAKARMDVHFEANRLHKDDPEYVYDKRIEFKPQEASDWDDEEEEEEEEGQAAGHQQQKKDEGISRPKEEDYDDDDDDDDDDGGEIEIEHGFVEEDDDIEILDLP